MTENYNSAELKQQSKQSFYFLHMKRIGVILLSAYEKNWSAFGSVKKIISYFRNNWLLLTTKIIWEKQVIVTMIKGL